MPEPLTIASFAGREHQTFLLTAGTVQLDVELVEVTQLNPPPSRGWGVSQVTLRPEPFSIVFRGPNDPPLQQSMYPMAHDDIGELGTIFLVPIAADAEGRYYEAVFN